MLPTPSSNGLMRQKSMLLLGKLLRTKEPDTEAEVGKKKLLSTSDLCSLGVGSCVGTGMYLVSGLVIRNYAGPGAIISFIIAAIASLLSGVCYAEFGVRMPYSTGTAYHYSYASVGEFIAFLIGWTLILEYMISTAAGASAIGAAIDQLFNGALSSFAMDLVTSDNSKASNSERPKFSNKFSSLSHQRDSNYNSQTNLNTFEKYSLLFDGSTYKPDFVAAILCLLMTLVLISGVKKSVKFNNYLNMFNLGVFIFIIIAALPLLSLKYWKTDYYNNYNLTTTNYLNRSKNLQTITERTNLQRVPYQRGFIKNNEIDNTQFINKNIVKRSNSIRTKLKQTNNQPLLYKLRRDKEKHDNIRSRFENLINKRLKRSHHHHDKRRKEHEDGFGGFGDDDEEDEDWSVVTPAAKYRTTSPKPETSTYKFELPTFKTMIHFKTQSTTTVFFEEVEASTPSTTTTTTTKKPTTTSTTTTTTTKKPTTTTTTTEKPTTTTTEATSTTTKPSTSTKRIFINDEDEEEITTTTVKTTTIAEEEEEYEDEETTTKKQKEKVSDEEEEEEEEEKEKEKTVTKGPIIRSTTEKPSKIKDKAKQKVKSKQIVKETSKETAKLVESGFLPFGYQGVFRGAATCFYGFIGFDIISSTGGQTEQPTRSIPIAMVSATLITLTAYIVTTLLISLTTPTNLVSSSTALVNIFDYHQMDFVKSIAAAGAISSLTVAMFGSMFPMPRVCSAMATDGLLPRKLAELNYYTNTPVFSTILLGTITSFLALIFPLQVLVEIMSIGTLVAYTLISTCILLLRYQPTKDNPNDPNVKNSLINCLPEEYRNQMIPEGEKYYQQMMLNNNNNVNRISSNQNDQKNKKTKTKRLKKFKSFNSSEDEEYDYNRNGQYGQRLQRDQSKEDDEDEDDEYLVDNENTYNYGSVPYQYGGSSKQRTPMQFAFLEKFIVYWFPYGWKVPGPATDETSFYVMKLLSLYFVLVICVDAILAFGNLNLEKHLLCFILLLLIVSLIFTLFTIARQPQTKLNLKFLAPGLPFVPAIAILINIYLIFRLSYLTLVRFTIWTILGLIIYFLYSIKNSSLEQLYCNVTGTDQYIQPYNNSSSQYYQQSDSYQTEKDTATTENNNNQSIELKNRNKYIDSTTMSILTTTELNPFLSTDFDNDDEILSKYSTPFDTQYESQYDTTATTKLDSEYNSPFDSKYDSEYNETQLPSINQQEQLTRNLSSIEEDSVTEDTVEEYDTRRKNPFLMDY